MSLGPSCLVGRISVDGLPKRLEICLIKHFFFDKMIINNFTGCFFFHESHFLCIIA